MSLIIDGHNLIPKLPGMSLSMPDDEEQLIKLLMKYSRVVKKKLIVYFDRSPAGNIRSQNFGNVSAHFIRESSSADAAIHAKLRQLGKGVKNWTVISSDHEIQRDARYAGANTISSEEFASLIFNTLSGSEEMGEISPEVYPDE
jgi:predicted RNA-binding protein with PIN domain